MGRKDSVMNYQESEIANYREIIAQSGESTWLECKPWAIGGHNSFTEFACILEMLKLPHGSNLMELGCGCGWLSIFLAKVGYKTLGIDLCDELMEIANRRASAERVNARFMTGDMQTYEPDQEVDGVVIYNALHHVADPQSVLRLACQNLRPGGRIVLGEPTWLHKYSPHAQDVANSRDILEEGFTRRKLRKMLRSAGFRKIEFYYESGRLYRSSPLNFLKALVRLILLRFAAYPGMKIWISAEK